MWCVLAGSTGTHSVCVCSIHQNAHLLVNAIGWEFTYKDFMNKLVCDSAKKECMMHRCELCPGKDSLRAFLDEQLSDVDLDDEFRFNQWDTTDRASLTTHTCTYREYIDLLIDSIDQLTRHSYLAKGQAKYLRDKKESLPKNEALILGDFAENYHFSFKMKFRVITGARNIVPCIQLSSIIGVIIKNWSIFLCASFQMTIHTIPLLFIMCKA